MFVMQKKDTFIRKFGEIGYITSQLTRKDRVYDAAGHLFLSVISRSPRPLRSMVDDLLSIFVGVSEEELTADLTDFVLDLEADGFLVTGDTQDDAIANDHGFSYAVESPKTLALRLMGQDRNPGLPASDNVMMDYFRNHPTVFGIHVEVTSRCNEKCVHCYQAPETRRDMDMALALSLMDQLAEAGTLSITFSGGEPTVHPKFAEILRMARSRDMIISVLSNGLNFSDELLSAFLEVNLNMCQISLYSMVPSIHDAITGVPGSHARTLATIERLIALDIPVQVSCPIMRLNKDSYVEVASWCSDRRIRVMSDFVMIARSNFDKSNLAERLSIEETGQVIQDILKADEVYHMQLDTEPRTRDLEWFSRQPVCGVCIDNACITSGGTLYPCSGFQNYPLGNISTQTLNDIWLHSEAVNRLRSITNASFPKCLKCEARDFCIMCLVRNFNESGGDMFAVAEHFCQVAFLNKNLVEKWRQAHV